LVLPEKAVKRAPVVTLPSYVAERTYADEVRS
jgi:hypothetical protein